ncbi:mechanosensitive ion channel [bacterium]|nr:mechanosensitive ion channel [bacterium]
MQTKLRFLLIGLFVLELSRCIGPASLLAQEPSGTDSTVVSETAAEQPTATDTSQTPSADRLLTGDAGREWSLTGSRVLMALIAFAAGYLVIRYLTRLMEFIAERRTRERLSIKAVIPVLRIFGWTLLLYFIIARIFAPPIQTLLALTASAGIAVGFAAQDILKNIFGGITILFDRPFAVGDKIQVGSHYGEVSHIGLRTVRIVTPDDSLVSLPNAEVAGQPVSNANSGQSYCQVVAEFFLPPDVDLTTVRGLALKAAYMSRYIYLRKPPAVVFKNEISEGNALIKMRLKAYVFDIRYEFAFSSDMTEILLDALEQAGIQPLSAAGRLAR